MTEQMDLFNRIAARALATAQASFPNPVTLRPADLLAKEELPFDKHTRTLAENTLAFLHREGFFSSPGTQVGFVGPDTQVVYGSAVLTARGLSAMNVEIQLRDRVGRAGDLLIDQMKEGAKDTRSAMVTEIISQIMTAVIKSYTG